MSLRLTYFGALVGILLMGSAPGSATQYQAAQWAEGSSPKSGASREYFNFAAFLKWRRPLGDWYDADGSLYGNSAFSSGIVTDLDREQTVRWDITDLVKGWRDAKYPNTGVFLRLFKNTDRGTVKFHSRENGVISKSPSLCVTISQISKNCLRATADTYLDPSTYRSLGQAKQLSVGTRLVVLLRFDDEALTQLGEIQKAELVLHTTAKQYGHADIGVFRAAPQVPIASPAPSTGIASRYHRDQGIEADTDVIFAERFESTSWLNSWSQISRSSTYDLVNNDTSRGFVPLSGAALRVVILEGNNTGLNLRYKFTKETGEEPEAAYFRYYLRLSRDWRPTVQGGKLPGFAGTYNVAGWGGRRSNGSNGWSMRGHFSLMVPPDNPLASRIPIGFYAYHANMNGYYGDNWMWSNGALGALKRDRWYCIEQYVRLNTVGRDDGIIRAWVDGQLAYERKNIRYRASPKLKIEEVWMNVYHGGIRPAPRDLYLYIDNVVIAHSYIGPIAPSM